MSLVIVMCESSPTESLISVLALRWMCLSCEVTSIVPLTVVDWVVWKLSVTGPCTV